MRYKNKVFTKNFKLVDKSSDVIDKKDFDDFLNKHAIHTYVEFINSIRKIQSESFNITYGLLLSGDYLILSTSSDFRVFDVDAIYYFEHDKIRQTLIDLFKLEEDTFKLVSGNRENMCSLGPNLLVLKLILSNANIEGRGEEPRFKFYIPKKDGTKREIIAPHEELKGVLKELNELLGYVYGKNNNVQFAYKNKLSIKDNAKVHKDKKYVFNMDIENFFPSCKRDLVRHYILFMFKSCPNREMFIDAFLDIILYNDALYIGSPISGVLANAILSQPVIYIKNMAKKCDMNFSIYADDMTFSSNKFISKDFVISLFQQGLEKYNLSTFSLKDSKSYGRQGKHKHVTGVSFSNGTKLTTSRKYYRDIRVQVHKLSIGQTVNIQKLKGRIAYAVMLDETNKLGKYLDKYKSTVKKFNLISDDKLNKLLSQ